MKSNVVITFSKVSVPINERELGEPVEVTRKRGFSNFYQEKEGVKVDWLHGSVAKSHGKVSDTVIDVLILFQFILVPFCTKQVAGVGIPFTGITEVDSRKVDFPSLTKFAWLP